MQTRPAHVIRARDFGKSLAFYRDLVGYEVTEEAAKELAVLSGDRLAILLAGPAVEDLTPYTAEGYRVLRRGIERGSDDLEAERARLAQAGFDGIIEEKPWGDRIMIVRTPEGLTVDYIQGAVRSREEEIAGYADAPNQLEALLADADLDTSLNEGSWTIRQNVHHLAEAQARLLVEITTALTAPGGHYAHSWQGNDNAASRLHYAERPIDNSVLVFRGCCLQIAELLGLYPDYRELEYYFRNGDNLDEQPQVQKLAETVQGMLSHTNEHIYEISQIRKAHSKLGVIDRYLSGAQIYRAPFVYLNIRPRFSHILVSKSTR